MENEIKQRVRNDDNKESIKEVNTETDRGSNDDIDNVEAPSSAGYSDTDQYYEETSDQRMAREAEEEKEQQEYIDNTEVFDGGTSTQLYRRAISDFDEAETEVQLSEHFVYTDKELKETGYF